MGAEGLSSARSIDLTYSAEDVILSVLQEGPIWHPNHWGGSVEEGQVPSYHQEPYGGEGICADLHPHEGSNVAAALPQEAGYTATARPSAEGGYASGCPTVQAGDTATVPSSVVGWHAAAHRESEGNAASLRATEGGDDSAER